MIREIRVPAVKREFKQGDKVGTHTLLNRGFKGAKVAWQLSPCSGCGTSPAGLVTEEHLQNGYTCRSSICQGGIGRKISDPRPVRYAGPEQAYTTRSTRDSQENELKQILAKEQQELARQKETQAQREAVQRAEAARKAKEEAKSNAKKAHESFLQYHNSSDSQGRVKAVLDYCRATGITPRGAITPDAEGIKKVIAQLNDYDNCYTNVLNSLAQSGSLDDPADFNSIVGERS